MCQIFFVPLHCNSEVHDMAEEQVSDKQLIEALLRERDELYRRATKAEHRLAELSDAEAMRQQYEARIKEKDNEISQMKADHQRRIQASPFQEGGRDPLPCSPYRIHGPQALGQDERKAPDSG